MTLLDQMTRCPRAFDPELGAGATDHVQNLAPLAQNLLHGAAGSSPYLAGLIQKEADWIVGAIDDPDAALAAQMLCGKDVAPDQLGAALRQGKRRVALLTALADLGGAWSLGQVTQALTDFADAATQAALQASIAAQVKRGKLPGVSMDDVETAGGMVVLAMGKMGAGELNYSSDIDLICLFDETRFDVADFAQARMGFVKATRAMSALLNDLTGDGYVFRTDLRLRPDPGVTPVCMAMEAAERYYESLGRTWERAAYIKARPAAGDLAAGDGFLKALRPFVWRKHLDFAAIQDAHDMRLAIREHKGLGGPITLPGHNMKLGRGGIREIEFFTQTRQLIAGGRDVDLRMRGTCEGLAGLSQKGWIDADVADLLTDNYVAHRTVEHRLQMVRDAQTHSLPQSSDGMARIACLMDMDVRDLEADLHRRLSAVHDAIEGFFAPSATDDAPEHTLDTAAIERWHSYPSLRSERAAALFERIKPTLLRRLEQAPRPQDALLAFDGFLAGLPAGVQLFALFDANPSLVDLLVDIVSTSPALAEYLSRNAGVFDAVIGGSFFAQWPGQDALQAELTQLLNHEADYEAKLDAVRRWNKEWHFRIGVHQLRGLVSASEAAAQYADLARAVIVCLWPEVGAQFAKKHGAAPGRGAVVLGMGSLGAGRLNATSDLDIIVIYDADGVEASSGPKPLAARQYYARLTQAMITAMTAPMAQGRLYEVDMRLRPSGTQGPVATSWGSFQSYQKEQAWVWEHLALTRAAVVAGADALGRDVEAFRHEVLHMPRDAAHILNEVAQMRVRIAQAKESTSVWDAKIGPGRLQDIELCAQAFLLISGGITRSVRDGIVAGVGAGLLNDADGVVLSDVYDVCWRVQMASKLLTGRSLGHDDVRSGGHDFLRRTMDGIGSDDLETHYAKAAAVIDRVVALGEQHEKRG
ncbi:glutamine-synthetase adenylyltransferase [Ascidiaceihabitans sp.]|uniref:[protein-PII] uridylyltransferase family protein n=1 Tax=Ascidiaceihabitans sp. TaxID=1872644 RepID=UPI003296A539